jgi:hypothetical protein
LNSGSTVAAQTVTFASTYGGSDVANYTYVGSATTTTAKVTPKALTLDSMVAANKVYDGGLTATITSFGELTGVVGSDAVALNSGAYSASFATKQVANGKAVTVLASSLGLTGAKAGNYNLIVNPSSTADITAKAITVSGIAANDKVYDGGTTASVTTTGAVFNGMPGAMRVPPMPVPQPMQPVPVPQGVPAPGALPYQPDGNPTPDDASGKVRS